MCDREPCVHLSSAPLLQSTVEKGQFQNAEVQAILDQYPKLFFCRSFSPFVINFILSRYSVLDNYSEQNLRVILVTEQNGDSDFVLFAVIFIIPASQGPCTACVTMELMHRVQ